MIHSLLETIGVWIQQVIASGGYFAVAGLMAIESACIPLPSEVIMPFAGSLTAAGPLTLWGVALAGALGCVLGSIPAYYLGQYGGRPIIERFGRYVLISHHDLDLADRLFAKYGQSIVFVARLLPVIRTFIAFPAGVARMNRAKFHIYTFVGSFPWCLGLAYVGQRLGVELLDEHSPLKQVMHKFDAVIGVVIVVAAVIFIRSRLKALKGYKADAAAAPEPAKD